MNEEKKKLSEINLNDFTQKINSSVAMYDAAEQYERMKEDYEKAAAEMANYMKKCEEMQDNLFMITNSLSNVNEKCKRRIDEMTTSADRLKNTTIQAKVQDEDWNRLTEYSKRIIAYEQKLHETNLAKIDAMLKQHYIDMAKITKDNEGIWLSHRWSNILFYIFFPCVIYTVVTIVTIICAYAMR